MITQSAKRITLEIAGIKRNVPEARNFRDVLIRGREFEFYLDAFTEYALSMLSRRKCLMSD